jgi:hypothetical protein
MLDAWHFLAYSGKMAHTDIQVKVGETYKVNPPVELCRHGLHASINVIHALRYAPGPIACRVRLDGDIVHQEDKCAASKRTVLWMVDASDILSVFARQCALDVAHLWPMPVAVREYLETGNENLADAVQNLSVSLSGFGASDYAARAAYAVAHFAYAYSSAK